MKKFLLGFIIMIGGICLLCSCEQLKVEKNKHIDTLAYEATTSLSLLNNTTTQRARRNVSAGEEDEFLSLLPQIELLLQNGTGFSNVSLESDNESYTYLEKITFNTSLNESMSYFLYFNKIDTKESQEDDETEVELRYDGIVVIDNQTMKFVAEIEKEQDAEEVEEEMEFKIQTSENSYVKVKQEIEIEENEKEEEYHYTVVENGKKVYEYSVSIEIENDETEVELELNNQFYKVTFESNKGENFIKFEQYGDDDDDYLINTVVYKVVLTDGVISYEKVK